MPTPILLTESMLEATSGFYTFTLDQDVAFLDTLTLTITDLDSGQTINSRAEQNILNANGGTVSTDVGPPVITTVTFELEPEDTVILNQNRLVEYRVLSFTWTWNTLIQMRRARHEVQFAVENILRVV